jgi:RND family efflux transporter MFP subunit
LAGAVTPYEQVTVHAKASGYLKSIAVDLGDTVRKGQLLAELEIPELEAQLDQKQAALAKEEANLVRAQAEAEQLRAQMEFQQLNFTRLKSVFDRDSDLLPENEVDEARAAQAVAAAKHQAAVASVKVAEAAVQSAKAEIRAAQSLKAYSRILAPISGVVTERFVDSGSLIQSASTSRTQSAPVVSIARVDKVRLVADVPEASAVRVRPGKEALLQLPTYPAESFSITVARIGRVMNPATRTMRVEFDLLNREQRFRPGMTARIVLRLQGISGAVTIPVAALRIEGENRSVFVVQGERLKRQPVKTGLESAEWVQVVEGLSGSEQVVLTAASNLTEGQKVQVKR